MRFSFPWLPVAIATLLWVTASSAFAQQWLSSTERAAGRGLRAGDFDFHPGIGSEVGYDSNVFLSETPESSGVLRVAPHLIVQTRQNDAPDAEPAKVSLKAGVNAALKHYFAFTDSTGIGLGQDLKLVLQPSSVFGFEVFDEFLRSIDPFTDPADSGATGASAQAVDYARNQLGVGARLQLSTPGQLLRGGVGYRADLDRFDDQAFQGNDSTAHTILADTSWEFLPKTAVFWNGTFKFHGYDDPALAPDTDRNDSRIIDSKLGLNGALTERIGFTISGGYGAGFFDGASDYDSVIAQLEARWRMRETLLLALGYDREYQPSFQGNSVRMDRVKARFQMLLAARIVLAARAEFSFLSFGRDNTAADPTRDDKHLLANLSGEYRMLEWLAVTGELGYIQNFTDYVSTTTVGTMTFDDPAKYKRFDAWLGLRAFW
jgi:hypothetical protein